MGIFDFFHSKDKDKKISELQGQLKTVQDYINQVGYYAGKEYVTILGSKLDFNSHFAIKKCIALKSNLISQIPIKLFKGETEYPIDTNLKLMGGGSMNLAYPHPDISWNELLNTSLHFFYYRGEFFIRLNREFNILESLNPAHMRLEDNLSYDRWVHQIGNKAETINIEELVYIKQFNPDKFGLVCRGSGVMDIIDRDLENDLHALKYSNQFWKNFTFVGGMIQVKKDARVTQKMLKEFVDDWNTKHKGSNQAGRTDGIPAQFEYVQNKHSLSDSQLLPLRKDTTERILAAQGVHKSLLGFTDQVNRSVAEESIRQLWKLNLQPDAIMIQEKLNQQLMREYFPGWSIKFDFSQINELQSINTELFTQAEKLKQLGYNTNEINTRLGLGFEEIDDDLMNTRFMPNNLIPYDMFIDTPEDKSEKSFKLEDLVPVKKEVKAPHGAYVNKYNILHAKSAKKIKSKIGRIFSKQLVDITKLLHKSKKDASVDFDLEAFLKKVKKYLEDNKEYVGDRLRPIYNEVSKAADKFASKHLNLNDPAIAYDDVVKNLINRVKDINDTTYKLIKTRMQTDIEAGATIEELADSLKPTIKANVRIKMIIARTESAAIINQSTDKRYKKAGVKKKQWLSVGDKTVRDTHASNHSFGVVKYDHVYANGQSHPNDGEGGASENVNCRCVLIPIVK